MIIRPETPHDAAPIRALTAAAFAGDPHSDGSEPAIIDALRGSGTLTLSLVAADDSGLAGHAAFSPVRIGGQDCGWYGLGPVSVRPDRQGAGIGSALIRDGLERLQVLGAAGCVVLGDHGYYRRFGFEHDPGLSFAEAPPEYFLRLVLRASAADAPAAGPVTYQPAFYPG